MMVMEGLEPVVVSFKESFVCGQSGVYTYRKLPHWRQLWKFFGQ
jgi:hypothetical protein